MYENSQCCFLLLLQEVSKSITRKLCLFLRLKLGEGRKGGGREREGGERERKGGRGEKKGGRGERKGWRKGICVFYYLLLPSSFWIGRREVAENVFFFWYVLEFHSGAIIAHSLIMGLGFKVSFVGVLESFEMNLY